MRNIKNGSVTRICSRCGKEYTQTSEQPSSDSIESWKEWILSRTPYCRRCFAIKKSEDVVETGRRFAISHSLPDIVAVSEKQEAYAERLRNHYIGSHLGHCARTYELISKIDTKTLLERARAEYSDESDDIGVYRVMEDEFERINLIHEFHALTLSSAQDLIKEFQRV